MARNFKINSGVVLAAIAVLASFPPAASAVQKPTAAASGEQPGDDVLLNLYKDKKLFLKKEYPTLRKVFADRFAQQHADALRQAFGSEYEAMTAWLDERPDIKEELYLAIDPQHDNVAAALSLFKELKEQFPSKIEAYAQLAIATAVTWDDERAVYDYKGHQARTKSKMPEGMLAAVENFKYLLDRESIMQGRAQFVPWEFLKHMVNHRTPLAERGWALENYLPKRQMFGKCYKDVPYDMQMLETDNAVCKLADKDYTLANLRSYGGVCAMQADFAARVGKSLGVPAEYVGGEGKFGGRHAWVMWVELKQVTKTSVVFSLESDGRYNIDKFYVGTLTDPQTGQRITDRQLELRLQTLGLNPQSARQAGLIMEAWPMLEEQADLDVGEQLALLREVIRLSPGNEEAWTALAKLSAGDQIEKKHHKAMMTALDALFTTFARFPDFTWTVFEDLVAFQTDAKLRNKLYERLVALYEAADRPDLACEARLKLTSLLVADKQSTPAIEGLAYTIKKFPDEGRYVPQMLDQLEAISKGTPGADVKLLQFYREFLPRIPQMRGSSPSEYCMAMFQRGIDRYKAAGQDQVAQALSAELAKIKAGQGRKG